MKKIIEKFDFFEAARLPIGHEDEDIKKQSGQVKGESQGIEPQKESVFDRLHWYYASNNVPFEVKREKTKWVKRILAVAINLP